MFHIGKYFVITVYIGVNCGEVAYALVPGRASTATLPVNTAHIRWVNIPNATRM